MWQRVQGVGEAFGLGVGELPPMPIGTFDTELAPAAVRADYYQTMLRSVVCAADARLEDRSFGLRVRARNGRLGAALYAHMQATPHSIERSRTDTRRVPTACYYLWRQRGSAGGLIETGGEQVRLARGDILVGDADEPMTVAQAGPLGFSLYLLPKAAVDPLLTARARDRLAKATVVAKGTPIQRMIAACADAAHDGDLSPAAAAGSGAILARLLGIAADEAVARTDLGREALGALRQGQILREIDLGYAEPDFCAADAAARLGLSVRSLHLALEPTGLSFTEHLTRRRLAEARNLLAAGEGRTVADVAFACGFNEVSTFYRAFRRVFDATPRDL